MDSTLAQLTAGYIDRIQSAAASKTLLRIRGGGSKDFYGQSLQGEILDTTALTGITSYEPSELVVTVRAGTPLVELEALLAEKNQCLPFEPPHYGRSWGGVQIMPPRFASQATVGGMVAAGLSGPSRAASGAVKDFVLGIDMINGKGEALHFGGTVMKNVAGYDVSRLMTGSMGTLGLITEVSLKVLPIAPAEATLRFVMDEAAMLRQVNLWGGQPLPLNASSWVIDKSKSDKGQPTLYLRLRGAVAAVEAACKKLIAEAASDTKAERVDYPETKADWTAARDLQLPWFNDGFERGDDLWRLSVPQTAPALAVGDTMIDWLGAQRWVWTKAGDVDAAMRLRIATQAVGGNATLFIANEAINTPATEVNIVKFTPLKAPLDRIHRQLKQEFDPAGIFNRGRMYTNL